MFCAKKVTKLPDLTVHIKHCPICPSSSNMGRKIHLSISPSEKTLLNLTLRCSMPIDVHCSENVHFWSYLNSAMKDLNSFILQQRRLFVLVKIQAYLWRTLLRISASRAHAYLLPYETLSPKNEHKN
jgi:hypothetical protein